MNGTVVFRQEYSGTDGMRSVKIDLSELADGFYILDITSGNAHRTQKFIKK
jgi:hypothetical protein